MDSSGFGFEIRCHSPLNALTSPLERPVFSSVEKCWCGAEGELTFIDHDVGIVEEYAMV